MKNEKTGNGNETGKIYNYEDVDIADILPALSWNVKPYNKTRFLRNIIALDTETAKLTDEIDEVVKSGGTKYSVCPVFKPLKEEVN